MKTTLTFICFWLAALASSAAEFDDYYARGRAGSDAYPDTAIYYIENYKDEYAKDIFRVASDPAQDTGLRSNMIGVMAIVVIGQPPGLGFSRLKELVEQIENEVLEDKGKMELLTRGYNALAMSGYPEALVFLKQRASFEHWSDHRMPETVLVTINGGRHESPYTAQGQALTSIRMHPDLEAEAFLLSCRSDIRYQADKYLENRIAVALELRSGNLRRRQSLRHTWTLRGERGQLLGRGASKDVSGGELQSFAVTSDNSPNETNQAIVPNANLPSEQMPTRALLTTSNIESPSASTTPYYAAGVVAALLGLLVLLARRKA